MDGRKERKKGSGQSASCVVTSRGLKKSQIVNYGKYDPVLTLSDRIIRYQIPMTSIFLYKRCKLLFAALSWGFCACTKLLTSKRFVLFFFPPLKGFKYYFIFFISSFISDLTSHTCTLTRLIWMWFLLTVVIHDRRDAFPATSFKLYDCIYMNMSAQNATRLVTGG